MTKRQQKRKETQRRAAAARPRSDGARLLVARPPVRAGHVAPARDVPAAIVRPPYARTAGSLVPTYAPGSFAQRMRAAGSAAAEVLAAVGAAVAPSVTTEELDSIVFEAYLERGGYPSTLQYKGYQKSICTSVNEVICHGIPDDRALQHGDIVNCDVTIYLDGVHGDTSATFVVGETEPRLAELVDVTRECTWRGIDTVRPGARLSDIGRAIQDHAEAHGFSVVRNFVGHGIGEEFHTVPSVPHYFDKRADDILEVGMTFTIEPMINVGGWHVGNIWSDGWTAPTADGLPSAQFEHTLMVTPTGVEVLTHQAGGPADRAEAPAAAVQYHQ